MTDSDRQISEVCALSDQKCIPCRGDLPAATAEEIQVYQTQVPQWHIITEFAELRLQRVYNFSDFKQALAFTNSVGEIAEEEGHHPAIATEWGKVTVTWWTHAIAGLHENDFIMAAKCDRIFRQPDNLLKPKLPGAKSAKYPLKSSWVNLSMVL